MTKHDEPEQVAENNAQDDSDNSTDDTTTRPEMTAIETVAATMAENAAPGSVPAPDGAASGTSGTSDQMELAEEALPRQPASTSDTQPVPIVTGLLRPIEGMPVVTGLLRPIESIPTAATAGSTPAAVETPVTTEAADTAQTGEVEPMSAPKIPFPPPTLLPEDDPNATNQLPPSSGLTGLDVLGALDDSSGSQPFAAALAALAGGKGDSGDSGEGLAPGIADEVDPNWAMADQPTVLALPPRTPPAPTRPAYLETGEQAVWPPRPAPATGQLREDGTPPPFQPTPNPRPIPRPATRPVLAHERLSSPTGRRPLGNTDAAYSDPRMRRYVELQLQRGAHAQGQRGPTDLPPVAQMVRQWWNDLVPGLRQALDHQHEARASGVYPLPAHEDTPPSAGTRLGDVFGRLGAAVRELGERAQSAVEPALKTIHERAEQAAQAIVGKIEGPTVRQQAPFLGPGRVAVFFRQGVTVGQAQRLLLFHRAQPMRLIPRKHGFLARVIPGREAEVGAELRQHPYVRDVVYLEYDNDPGQDEPAAAR